MAYETKEMTGALFVNENKEHDRQPDYTGNIKINGKLWRLAGWKTESRGGIDYIGIRISDPEEFKRQQQGQMPQAPTRRLSDDEFQRRRREQMQSRPDPAADYDDDDIPF